MHQISVDIVFSIKEEEIFVFYRSFEFGVNDLVYISTVLWSLIKT